MLSVIITWDHLLADSLYWIQTIADPLPEHSQVSLAMRHVSQAMATPVGMGQYHIGTRSRGGSSVTLQNVAVRESIGQCHHGPLPLLDKARLPELQVNTGSHDLKFPA